METIEWIDPKVEKPKNDERVIACYIDGEENNFWVTLYNDKKHRGVERWGEYREPDYWARLKGPKTQKTKNIIRRALKSRFKELEHRIKQNEIRDKELLKEKKQIENKMSRL